MSADSSDHSESNQSLRYQKAADRALPTASQPGPSEQRLREATRRQAEDDRRKRGEARKIDQVSALFGDSAPKKPGARFAANEQQAPDDDAGRDHAPPSSARPALELTDEERAEDGEDQPKRKKAKSIVDFAAEHEIEPKQLYDLAIPLEAGQEPVTISQLKDHFKETRDFEQKRDDFADWSEHVQGEIVQYRQQIQSVVNRLTEVVPPELLARAYADTQMDLAANYERNVSQLREWFPEWDDVQVKTRDRQRLETVLGTYGFTKFEVGNVNDARLIKFAMDAVRKAERYERLKNGGTREKVPTKEPASSRKPRQPNATDQAQQLAKAGDKVGAVAKLLGG